MIFLDTVGMIAVWDETDQWHRRAAPVFDRVVAAKERFVTTSYVLSECGNAAARRPFRADVVELREFLRNANAIIDPTDAEVESAWKAYEAGRPSSAGIVDELSFRVMRRLGIRHAFTNDRHFTVAGFDVMF